MSFLSKSVGDLFLQKKRNKKILIKNKKYTHARIYTHTKKDYIGVRSKTTRTPLKIVILDPNIEGK